MSSRRTLEVEAVGVELEGIPAAVCSSARRRGRWRRRRRAPRLALRSLPGRPSRLDSDASRISSSGLRGLRKSSWVAASIEPCTGSRCGRGFVDRDDERDDGRLLLVLSPLEATAACCSTPVHSLVSRLKPATPRSNSYHGCVALSPPSPLATTASANPPPALLPSWSAMQAFPRCVSMLTAKSCWRAQADPPPSRSSSASCRPSHLSPTTSTTAHGTDALLPRHAGSGILSSRS